MRKIRKSKPPEQAIEQYTFYGTVIYTCPYCSAQLGRADTNRRPERCPECGQPVVYPADEKEVRQVFGSESDERSE